GHLVPVADRGNLQLALDRHAIVRLEAGDYRVGGPERIVLRSGRQLHGLCGTRIPEVVVPGGTCGAVLSAVSPVRISFPPSDRASRHNTFRSIRSSAVEASGAVLEENLFLDLHNVRIHVDNSRGGHIRHNRFIRTMVHQVGPDVVLKGNARQPSYGNVLLWVNILTPRNAPMQFDDQEGLVVVGVDAESWNWEGRCPAPLLTVGRMGTLRLFAAQGANLRSGGKNATGLLDAAAKELHLYDVNLWGRFTAPNVLLREDSARLLMANCRDYGVEDRSSGAFRLKAFAGGTGAVTVNGVRPAKALPPEQQKVLRAMLAGSDQPVEPWERPRFGPLPDPAGPEWRKGLDSKPDHTAELQKRIDTEGIVLLDAGVHYISSPLRVGHNQGLIGAGADRTAIVARKPNVDMIAGDTGKLMPFVLADLTLQGGRSGIHHATPWTRCTGVWVSNVTFRNMAHAGIFLDKINTWDNNFLDHVNFVDCPVGFRQLPDPNYPGGHTDTMCFVDKVVFHQCRFVRCGVAVDMPARRPNNLNAWINCLFQDNREAVARLTNCTTHLFANCELIDNGGDPCVQSNRPVHFVSCRFQAGRRGGSMLPKDSSAAGCVFLRGTSSGAKILSAPGRNHFYNCTSVDVPLGRIDNGLLLNSELARDAALSNQAGSVQQGTPTVLIPGRPGPRPQLLVGKPMDVAGDSP
ncbi:MAG: hypothetical protein WBF17_18915, partial [Phycisphaerae bacterium]